MSLNCGDCKFALFADYGWSNYTTEGTEFFCMIGAHPEPGFDRWFGEDKRLEYANECGEFVSGDPVEMDVDGENYEYLTDEQKALYAGWNR